MILREINKKITSHKKRQNHTESVRTANDFMLFSFEEFLLIEQVNYIMITRYSLVKLLWFVNYIF